MSTARPDEESLPCGAARARVPVTWVHTSVNAFLSVLRPGVGVYMLQDDVCGHPQRARSAQTMEAESPAPSRTTCG